MFFGECENAKKKEFRSSKEIIYTRALCHVRVNKGSYLGTHKFTKMVVCCSPKQMIIFENVIMDITFIHYVSMK